MKKSLLSMFLLFAVLSGMYINAIPTSANHGPLGSAYHLISMDGQTALVINADGTMAVGSEPAFQQIVTGITSNGAGTALDMSTSPKTIHTLTVNRTAGATDVVSISIQCSGDNSTFVQVATITDLSNEPVLASHSGSTCYYLQYNITTIGAGNTVDVVLSSSH